MSITRQCLLACVALQFSTLSAAARDDIHIITARDLAKLRDINGLNASPDGNWVAFNIVEADPDHNRIDIHWHVLDVHSKRARRIADGGQMLPTGDQGIMSGLEIPRVSRWSPDNRWIAYLRRDNGRTQIWLAPRDVGDVRQLTHNEADVANLAYTRDGRRILFRTEPSQAQIEDARASEGRTGFLYDERFVPMASRRPISPRDTDYRRWWESTASQIAAQRLWTFELESGRERPATAAERAEYSHLTAPAHAGPAVHDSASSLGGAIAWTEARDPERQGMSPPLTIVARLPDASTPIVCEAAACTGGDMQGLWWRNGDELLFIRKEGLRLQDSALYAWRPNDAREPRLILHTTNFLRRCAVVQDKLLCFYERPDYPRSLVAIDVDRGSMETLYDPNPEFSRFDLGEAPQRLHIRADSGVETFGYLVRPPNHRKGTRLPLVIVTYHCDGFLRGSTGDEYPVFPFTAQGFAVLCFARPLDLDRASRMDATSYENWLRGPGIPARLHVEDALDAALAQLDRMGVIDPARVGITGLSYGAEIVHYALPHLPRLAAAISAYGAIGPTHYPYAARARRAMWRSWGLGTPDETPERWRENSFSPHVSRVSAPLLVNVADLEFLGALDSITALEVAGRAVETYVFPDEYHVKWQPAHRLAIYERNIDWLNFWLRGVENSDAAKADQYRRWRAMRESQCRLFGGPDAPWYCHQDPDASASQK